MKSMGPDNVQPGRLHEACDTFVKYEGKTAMTYIYMLTTHRYTERTQRIPHKT